MVPVKQLAAGTVLVAIAWYFLLPQLQADQTLLPVVTGILTRVTIAGLALFLTALSVGWLAHMVRADLKSMFNRIEGDPLSSAIVVAGLLYAVAHIAPVVFAVQ